MSDWNINPEILLKIQGEVWIYWKDIHGIFLGCNDFMAECLKLASRHNIVGYNDIEIPFLKNAANLYQVDDHKVMTTRSTKQFNDFVKFGNRIINFLAIKSPLLKNDQQLDGIVGISYYLSEALDEIFPPDKYKNNNLLNILSRQELLCLKLAAAGKTAKETAKILLISPRTVESYLENIKQKFSCKSKREIVKFYRYIKFEETSLNS